MNNLDKQYLDLLRDIQYNGVKKGDRTGTGTFSVFGRQIRHNMKEGFPILTTKKMAWKQIVTELLWFLKGSTDIRDLWKNNCHIWDGDWHKSYSKKCSSPYSLEEMMKLQEDTTFGESVWSLGPIYGKQWREWESPIKDIETDDNICFDQMLSLINDLKNNPDSRRLMVSAWNISDLSKMVLPPCHYGFQCWTKELTVKERLNLAKERFPNLIDEKGWKEVYSNDEEANKWFSMYDIGKVIPTRALSLMTNIRSSDVPLGLPFNIASYGLLLEILGKLVNMTVNELIINLGDTHIYSNQVDGVKEQLSKSSFDLPRLRISENIDFNKDIDTLLNICNIDDFKLENYNHQNTILFPLSN